VAVNCTGHINFIGFGEADDGIRGIGNNLVGVIPTEIGDLTEIRGLALAGEADRVPAFEPLRPRTYAGAKSLSLRTSRAKRRQGTGS
jgi:hypothetical protein